MTMPANPLSGHPKTSDMYATLTQEEFFKLTSSFSSAGTQRPADGLHIFKTTCGISGIFRLHQQFNKRDYYTICFIPKTNKESTVPDRKMPTHGQLHFLNPTANQDRVLEEAGVAYYCTFRATCILPKIRDHFYRLPMFHGSSGHWLQLEGEHETEVHTIFERMLSESNSSYRYKHDLVLTHLFELIHYVLKLQPSGSKKLSRSAKDRITSFFIELLESQFPIERRDQRCTLRFARDFSRHLCVHVNHLNRAIRETTGKTTSQFISDRIASEAKFLLRHTDWSISEIGYSLGFEEPSNFNSFFRKHTEVSPSNYRQSASFNILINTPDDVV